MGLWSQLWKFLGVLCEFEMQFALVSKMLSRFHHFVLFFIVKLFMANTVITLIGDKYDFKKG